MAPLTGVRVVDITRGAAGPLCTKALAELGADVLKIEPPGGDPARFSGPFPGGVPHPERGAAFLFRNTGKRSMVAALDGPEGRALLSNATSRAHCLVSDLTPAAERALGLDLATLAAANPALVLTHVTPFGRSGPLADAPADELTVQALSGFMDLHGLPDRAPLQLPGEQAAHIAGLAAAVATLGALLAVRRGQHGRVIDTAAVESMLALIFGPVMMYSYTGVARSRMGNRSATYGPLTDAYACRDGHVAIAIETSRQWETLCALLDRLDLIEKVPWGTAVQQPAEVAAVIQGWLSDRTRHDAFTTMQEYRLPAGMVLTPNEVLTDPHCAARGFFTPIDHPVAGRLLYPGAPVDAEGFWQVRPAPLLGAGDGDWMVGVGGDAHPTTPPSASPNVASHPDTHHSTPITRAALPLSGVRILDLTMVWAGPFATHLLADLGAEVIKVEALQRVDMVRWGASADGRPRESAYNAGGSFHSLNRNKLGITLDLSSADGREALLRLVESSDGLVENYSRRVMENFGLDFPVLQAANPRLVMISMPGYGATGPYRDYVSFGEVLEGMAGIQSLSRYDDGGPPLRHGIAYIDPVGGYHGALAMLAGLLERGDTGAGRHIVLAQRDAAIRLIGELVLAAQMRPDPNVGSSAIAPEHGPYGVYPSRGHPAWVAIAVTSDDGWRSLCDTIGRADLGGDANLATAAGRAVAREAIDAAVTAWTSACAARAAATRLIPFSMIHISRRAGRSFKQAIRRSASVRL